MGLYQTLYFMSLVGGVAGLFSWAATGLIAAALTNQTEIWTSDLIAATILGGSIGGLTVAFSDRWSGNRIVPRWIISGVLLGLAAGAIAGTVQIPITKHLAAQAPMLNRLIVWMLVGSFIGFALGLRWVHLNRARVAHAYIGGLAGGALGGMIFAGLGSRVPDLSQAVGFVFVGVGICFGVTLAPILLRDGVLQFISSGDARAQMKFGRSKKEWELHQGDSYVIGSRNQSTNQTRYRPEVEIFVPDATIAAHHAVLFGKEGKFYLARHPDAGGQAGLARYVVRVRGKTVTSSFELRDTDDILIGRTALKFATKRPSA